MDGGNNPPAQGSWGTGPSTPMKSSTPSGKTRSSVLSKKADISKEMDRHGMLQDDDAFNDYPELQRMVEGIVNAQRPASAVKDGSAKKYQHHLKAYKKSNEPTLLEALTPSIFKDSYTPYTTSTEQAQVQGAPTPPPSTPALSPPSVSVPGDGGGGGGGGGGKDLEEKFTRIIAGDPKDWYEEGQKFALDTLFEYDMLPNAYSDDDFPAIIAQKLAKERGMKTPKPDRVWGIEDTIRPVPSGIVLSLPTQAALEIVPNLHSPYLILEGKSNRGSHQAAEDQARRGGASLVNCALTLQDRAGHAPNLTSAQGNAGRQADLNAIVFSATLDPTAIQFWVHWAERLPDNITHFHMNYVDSKTLREDGAQDVIRTWSQNIHAWGCLSRRDYLNDLYLRLYDKEQSLMKSLKRKAIDEQEQDT